MYDLSITKNANISIIYELNKKYTIFFFVQFRPPICHTLAKHD